MIPRKLKNFKDKKKLTDRSLYKSKKDDFEEDEEEEIIGGVEEEVEDITEVLQGNIQIERIVDCKRPLKYSTLTYREIYQTIFVGNVSETYEKSVMYGGKSNFKFFVQWKGLFYEDSTFEDEFIVLKYKNLIKAYFELKIIEETIGELSAFSPLVDGLLTSLSSRDQPLLRRVIDSATVTCVTS